MEVASGEVTPDIKWAMMGLRTGRLVQTIANSSSARAKSADVAYVDDWSIEVAVWRRVGMRATEMIQILSKLISMVTKRLGGILT